MQTAYELIMERKLDKRNFRKKALATDELGYCSNMKEYKENPDNLKLHLFKKNYGYKSLWKSGLWYKFMFNYSECSY